MCVYSPALALTRTQSARVLQPKFTQYAIDWYILPRKTDGLMLLVGLYLGAQFLRFVFSYFQSILVNSVGQYTMFDIRKELYDFSTRKSLTTIAIPWAAS